MDLRLKTLFILSLVVVYAQLVMTGAVSAQTISATGDVRAGMDATAIATVTIPVVAITQIIKWAGLPDKRGPLAVIALSVLGVIFWGWSTATLSRVSAFSFFAGATLVMTSAAGVFGFTRSLPEAVTATSNPPAGAGASPTVKRD